MALQDLNRSSDTTGDGVTAIPKPTTNKLADITPVNWHRFPPRIGDQTKVNAAAEAKPRYHNAADWAGGVTGDDVDQATAYVALARQDGSANEADYGPRTQAQRAAAGNLTPATVIVTDIARPRGWIAPNQPLQGNASAPVAPVVSSLSPNTGAAAAMPIRTVITGTGFTPYSVVKTGGSNVPETTSRYIDATHMEVVVWKASAGTVGVIVEDHNLDSNSVNFTVT